VVALHGIDDVEALERRDRRPFHALGVDSPLEDGHELVLDVGKASLRVALVHPLDYVLNDAVDDLLLARRVGGVVLVHVVENELDRVEAVLLGDVDSGAEAGVRLEVGAGDDRCRDLVLEVA
jgi:hypothetical protein